MNIAKTVAAAIAIATFGLAGCGGGVEGTYKLDKTEMKKAMEAEVAKLPADQQGMAKLGMALIEAMDISLELQSGGKLKMKSTMPSFDKDKPAQTKEEDGTWKEEGDSIVLDNGDGKPVKCAKGAGKLSCDPEKKGEPGFVFVKG
ncbi:MAG: hypothetical protein IT372_11755 [Polyangiaceae bacterium]|nr:hypothetical protein [Polyangiaceae bacterium]